MDTANESLQFQKVSSLGIALEKVFQEAIDFKNNTPFDDQKKEVSKYCKTTLIKNICKVYKDTVNIDIDSVYLSNRFPAGAGMCIGDTEETNDIIYTVSDQNYGLKKITSASIELKELIELYKSVDSNTGKISNITFGKRLASLSLFLPVHTYFLLYHHVSPEVIEEVTAKEMTAIFLHETGHYYSMLERLQDKYLTINRITSHLSTLADKYSTEDIAEAILDNEKEMSKLIGSDIEAKNNLDISVKCANTLLYLHEKCEETDNHAVYLTFKLLGKVIWFVIFNIFYKLTIHPFISSLSKLKEYSVPMVSTTNKYTDTIATRNLYLTRERDADEYMVRSGYGEHFLSYIRKIDKLHVYLLSMKSHTYSLNNLSNVTYNYTLLKLLSGFYKNTIYNKDYLKYGTDIERCKSICREHISALKSLPPEDQGMWLRRYEVCINEYQKLQKDAESNITIIMRFIEAIASSPSRVVDSLITGKTNNDYMKLQKQVEEIVNNKLYFYGLKLKQLSR